MKATKVVSVLLLASVCWDDHGTTGVDAESTTTPGTQNQKTNPNIYRQWVSASDKSGGRPQLKTLVGLDMDGPRSPNTPASTLRLWVAQRTPVRMLQRQHARKQTVVWQCKYQCASTDTFFSPIPTKQGIKHANLLWTCRGSSGFLERPGCACYCFQR